MYAVIEFNSKKPDDLPMVDIVCKSWIGPEKEEVRFPPQHQYNSSLTKLKEPRNNWKKYTFKILKSNLSLDDAKKEREKYVLHSNTASEVEYERTKRESRRHPVNHLKNNSKELNIFKKKMVQIKNEVKINNY
jgi:hypothetical protein